MGCFCHHSLAALTPGMAGLSMPYTEPAVPTASDLRRLAAEALIAALSRWLAQHGLPAAPWQPDPILLEQPLPQVRLSAQALATISAFATLRAQVLAQFGIDLLVPAQHAAFVRIAATLNAHIAANAAAFLTPALALDAAGWTRLASLHDALRAVKAALEQELLAPAEALLQSMLEPGNIPMAQWRQPILRLQALAPLLAAAAQLNLSVRENFSAQLSAALRVMRTITLPPIPMAQLSAMATVTAALSATARLEAGLGVNPLKAGYRAIRQMVMAELASLVQSLQPTFAPALAAAKPPLGPANLKSVLASLLPRLPYCPTHLASSDTMQAALSVNAEAIESMNWQVPAISAVSVLSVGLPVVSFAATMHASATVSPVKLSPCGSGCDAAKIMRALGSPPGGIPPVKLPTIPIPRHAS